MMSRDVILTSGLGTVVAIGLIVLGVYVIWADNQQYVGSGLILLGIVMLTLLVLYIRRTNRERNCVYNFSETENDMLLSRMNFPLLLTIGEGTTISPETQQAAANAVIEKAKHDPKMPAVPTNAEIKLAMIHDLPLCYEQDKIMETIGSLQQSLKFHMNKAVFSEYSQDKYRFLVAFINMPEPVEKFGAKIKSLPL